MHLSLLQSITSPATYEKTGTCHIKSRNKQLKNNEVSICANSVCEDDKNKASGEVTVADSKNYDKMTDWAKF